MRAIWRGVVSFGLVSIAVRLYSATQEKDIRFHQVHRVDGGRIRYKRVCQLDGEEVSYDEIAKGYDIGGGEMVVLTDEDFADLPLSTSRAIDVLEFVPADQVDPILYNKAYYLEPEGAATKPYLLLRDALSDSARVAIVKVALRQREQLATLRVRDRVLVLNTMLWPDEVRRPDFGFLDEEIAVRPPELAMANSLIESMTGDFEPDAFTDDYRAALQEVINAKVEGREVVQPEEVREVPAPAVDLMAALRASVERARTARGEAPTGAREPTPISSARSARQPAAAADGETGAKKAAAKKATGRKAAADKKTAGAAKSTGAKKAAAGKAKTAKQAGRDGTTAKKAAGKKAASRKSA